MVPLNPKARLNARIVSATNKHIHMLFIKIPPEREHENVLLFSTRPCFALFSLVDAFFLNNANVIICTYR